MVKFHFPQIRNGTQTSSSPNPFTFQVFQHSQNSPTQPEQLKAAVDPMSRALHSKKFNTAPKMYYI